MIVMVTWWRKFGKKNENENTFEYFEEPRLKEKNIF